MVLQARGKLILFVQLKGKLAGIEISWSETGPLDTCTKSKSEREVEFKHNYVNHLQMES